MFLARQPRTLDEARAWTRYLVNRGRTVSIGLLQVNSEHATSLGLTWDQLFDPCTNVRVGAHLLTAYYRQAAAVLGDGQQALEFALSGYNSGLPLVGFSNGYVDTVIHGEFTPKPANDLR
jgi:type IV secretion system protein VirB1